MMQIEPLHRYECDGCGKPIWTNGDVDCDDQDGTIEHECNPDVIDGYEWDPTDEL